MGLTGVCRMFSKARVAALGVALFASLVQAKVTQYETDSMRIVEQLIRQDLQTTSKNNLLVVFDFDSTLFRSKQIVGSDFWLDWQANLIKQNSPSPYRVAATLDELFQKYDFLVENYTISELMEPRIPKLFQYLNHEKIDWIVLTARGHDVRSATLRDLAKHEMLANRGSGPDSPIIFTPTDLDTSFSTEALLQQGVNKFRSVAWGSPLLTTQGQNKGVMLDMWLKKYRPQTTKVIFVDDRMKHVLSVTNAFKDRPVAVKVVWYNRDEERVQAFTKPKLATYELAHKEWQALQRRCSSMLLK